MIPGYSLLSTDSRPHKGKFRSNASLGCLKSGPESSADGFLIMRSLLGTHVGETQKVSVKVIDRGGFWA